MAEERATGERVTGERVTGERETGEPLEKKARLYDSTCGVCRNPMSVPVRLTCGHMLDKICASKLLTCTCPMCNGVIDSMAPIAKDDPISREIDAHVDWKDAYTKMALDSAMGDERLLEQQKQLARRELLAVKSMMGAAIISKHGCDFDEAILDQLAEYMHLHTDQILSVLPIAPRFPVTDARGDDILFTSIQMQEGDSGFTLILSSRQNIKPNITAYVLMDRFDNGFKMEQIHRFEQTNFYRMDHLDNALIVNKHVLVLTQIKPKKKVIR